MGELPLREFNSKLRAQLLNGEIFYSMKEIRVLAEGGESTTTPSGRALRWVTGHRRTGSRYVLPTPLHPRLRRDY